MVNALYGREKYDDNGYPRVSHSKHRGFYEVDWGIAREGASSSGKHGSDEETSGGHASGRHVSGQRILNAHSSDENGSDEQTLVGMTPDLKKFFNLRPDVGAVIGRVLDKRGRMTECIADKDGNWLYAGTPKNYSGELNRFDCNQDVYMADIQHVIVRPELTGLLKSSDTASGDSASASRAFADELRRRGYLILYIPKLY